ncbi:hypothetical protein Ahy_B10g102110 [Arachis hypogaea]|uniref:RNase H type-1 domain-containing protein n=1 Tax=Arachis hypogaea TaxID=3818 RepID=A0A444X166_ARAHY|nr:hypothetical protein Ahy_B10g102110 [Arachis hypogaea]
MKQAAGEVAQVRDWQGRIITGITTKFKTTSALVAEAQAYREALILITNLQLRKCIIETDCLPLVQAIKAKPPLAEADAIIRDIPKCWMKLRKWELPGLQEMPIC